MSDILKAFGRSPENILVEKQAISGLLSFSKTHQTRFNALLHPISISDCKDNSKQSNLLYLCCFALFIFSGDWMDCGELPEIETMNAATVVILRRCVASTTSQWEVLLGQNVVKNWLRSTKDNTVIMRYPGEWKFPGGVVEPQDPSLKSAAIRELNEEFLGLDLNDTDLSLFLVNKKLTKPIKGRRYVMHNFVAMEVDNPWITNRDIKQIINDKLHHRTRTFERCIKDYSFWELDDIEKSNMSPELVCVDWHPLHEAISLMGSSLNDRLVCVNDWQRQEFEKYGINQRDPMFQSMVTLMEIEELRTYENIIARDRHLMKEEATG